jgi:hypothetical protein
MAGQYTDFDGIGSGESGTVEGLLPIDDADGAAEAFRYRKHIIVNVILPVGAAFVDLTGEWKVRVREDGSREDNSPTGAYSGAILFEQTVKWTARIVAGGGGNPFWMPLGDGGSGKQMTSICDGEECAVVEDVNDAAAMAAYGQNGAWRFVDANIKENATDRQKYDAEKGFTLFDNSGGTVGYQFAADWQSAGYRCEIPQGAILETVSDHWSGAALDSEANYLFSYKPGTAAKISLVADSVGGLCVAMPAKQNDKSGVQLLYKSDDGSPWQPRAFVEDASAPLLARAGNDGFLVLAIIGKTSQLWHSVDFGRSVAVVSKPFENPLLPGGETLDGKNLQQQAFVALPDGGASVLATEKGFSPQRLWLITSRDLESWSARMVGVLPDDKSAKALGMTHEVASGGSRLVFTNGSDLLRATADFGASYQNLGEPVS